MSDRRSFFTTAGKLTAAASLLSFVDLFRSEEVLAATKQIMHLSPLESASDEDYWSIIRQAYSVSPNIINLNNGGVSPQPIVTQDALDRLNRQTNQSPPYYIWDSLPKEKEIVRRQLAEMAGVDPEEIAINRNTSEGLETVIFGLDLKEGDEILTTTQDYPNMMNALHQREIREKIKLVKISIPVPCEDNSLIVERFREAITPRTKAILVSHMINLSGQIMPVRMIADMAHAKNVEVICDGAHTFSHIDYKVSDLHVDYFATSLHKWTCAPFGTGMLWMKKEKIKNHWALFAPIDPLSDDIRKFEWYGTRSSAVEAAIGVSISFHRGIGTKRKEERLRYLTNYWVDKVSKFPKVKLHTSRKREFSCGLFTFGIEGIEPKTITEKLYNDYKIVTTPIGHKEFSGVRVTPHVYTSLNDLDYFVKAVEKITKT